MRVLALGGLIAALGPLTFPLLTQTRLQPLTLISAEGRRTLDTIEVDEHEMVPLDALAAEFRLDVGENTDASTLTVSAGAQTVILTANQQLASVEGRLVSLGAPPQRVDGRWFVPLDFIGRALAPIYSQRIELRQRSRLLLIGEIRVPRVSGRYRPRGRGGRLSLDITPNTQHEVTEENGRILVRFDADAIDVVRHPQARGEVARDIRIIETPPTLSIELGPSYASHDVSLMPTPDGAAQLVIDLRAVTSVVTDARPEPSISTLPRPPQIRPPARTDAPPEFGAAPTIRTIVVDAGHGGSDEGARGLEGSLEKDITLSVARLLTAALERRLGVRVILTRSRDNVVELDQRAAIANNSAADLFISLHVNSSISQVSAGAEVFYLSIDEYGAEARELADRDGYHLPITGGGTREIDMILWEMAQVRYLERSATFAQLIEEELRRRVPMSPRITQQAPFRVLVGANMPAVLVEMGFISNPVQEQELLEGRFQTSIVEAIVAGVLRFKRALEQSQRTIASDGIVGSGNRAAVGAFIATDDSNRK